MDSASKRMLCTQSKTRSDVKLAELESRLGLKPIDDVPLNNPFQVGKAGEQFPAYAQLRLERIVDVLSLLVEKLETPKTKTAKKGGD
jgi:hypothetical protein